MNNPQNRDELITEFCGLTGAPPQEASQYLEASKWDLSMAATEYFTSQEDDDFGESEENTAPEAYTGPRTLDGRPAPVSATPTASSRPPTTGFATLGSLNQASASSQRPQHGHDGVDLDDEEYQPRDLFAGGEKSGLVVQDPKRNDPKRLVNDIIQKAQMNSKRPGSEPASTTPSRFRGAGMTVGSEDTPSQVVPDPHAPARASANPIQSRVLHLWNDGFSIDDGPLHRFDDPRNSDDLALIRSGRAPIRLMNVNPNQPVDVKVHRHDENYKPLPKTYKPFSGSGQRLGSPTPGSPGVSTALTETSSTTVAAPAPPDPGVEIDPSQPVVSLRIQLANGARLPARFNTTHTIGDVYDFVERSFPESSNQSWVLATIFPNKDHKDRSVALGEVPEFRKGGTAIQKWI